MRQILCLTLVVAIAFAAVPGYDRIGYPLGLAGPMIALFAASIAWRTAALESARPLRRIAIGGALATLWLFATTWMWLFTE